MSIIRKDIANRPQARLRSKLSVVRPGRAIPDVRLELKTGGEFSVYSTPPLELEKAIDQLSVNAIEKNVFQSAPFVFQSMKLEGAGQRLALIHNSGEPEGDERPAALMAFRTNVDENYFAARVSGFSQDGSSAPLIGRDHPMATIDQLFEALASPLCDLPGIVMFPDLVADGHFMRLARAVAAARGLAFRVARAHRRRALTGSVDPSATLTPDESSAWQANLSKWQELKRLGNISYRVHRNADEIATVLEMLGQLDDQQTHPLAFSHVAAICRALARRDWLRVHALYLGDRLVAATLQPVLSGEAWIWQFYLSQDLQDMALDEQSLIRLSEWNLQDRNITVTRIGAGRGRFLAESFWPSLEGRATLMIALKPGYERALDQLAARQEATDR